MIEYIQLAFSKYAQFDGRSRRSEFWYLYLGFVLTLFAVGILGSMIAAAAQEVGGYLFMILIVAAMIGFFIPFISCAVRRLHDTGKSAWWLLLYFVPFGGIVLLVFWCTDSDPGANEYGPNPKMAAATDITSHLVD